MTVPLRLPGIAAILALLALLCAPPIATAHPFTKPDPRIVAVVPPAVLPTAGKIESTETPAP